MQVTLVLKILAEDGCLCTKLKRTATVAQVPAPDDYVIVGGEDYKVKHSCYPTEPTLTGTPYPPGIILQSISIRNDGVARDFDYCVHRFKVNGWYE